MSYRDQVESNRAALSGRWDMVYTRYAVSYQTHSRVCLHPMTNVSAKLDRPEQRQIRGFNILLPSSLTVCLERALCTVLGADSA